MNHLQIAKVAHEATRALGETTGESDSSQAKWEQLSDQQRRDKTDEIAAHISRHLKGVNVDDVAKPLAETEKLKHYITAGVADAFLRHEAAQEHAVTAAQRERSQPKYLSDTYEAQKLEAKKFEAEKQRAQKTEPSSVDDALAKADAGLAKTNASNEPYRPTEP